jgi:hypothetical protein
VVAGPVVGAIDVSLDEPLGEVPEAAALALGAGVANPIDAACVPVKV